MTGPTPATGLLLVASPGMSDPNFSGTVVLLLNVDDDGAFGVVLNRPGGTEVDTVLPGWSDSLAAPGVLFEGGPVGPDGAVALGALANPGEDPMDFQPVTESLVIVNLDGPAEEIAASLRGMRLYAGYAGWEAGQLEGEIARGDWFVVTSEASDVMRPDVEDLWREVLRRQPGELAWNATRPVDPEMN